MAIGPLILVRTASAAAARTWLEEQPETRAYLAGGIDLQGRLKEGIDAPEAVVTLHSLGGEDGAALRGIAADTTGGAAASGWMIGALTTLAEVAAAPAQGLALPAALVEAAGSAATPSLRNLATVGGNLLQRPRCWYFRHRDLDCLKKTGPSCLAADGENRYHAILGGGPCHIVHPSTLATPLLALGAEVEVLGGAGLRMLAIGELFASPRQRLDREHTLGAGELLRRIRLPAAPAGLRSVYEVAKEKQSFDWPLAEVAVALELRGGEIASPRIALGHVAPIPWRARALEEALVGRRPGAELFAELAPQATEGARPLGDNAYKIPLVHGLVRAALHRCCGIAIPE